MHFAFIPYGKRESVERVLRNIEAQKCTMKFTKGKESMDIWVDCQLRFLPFGVYEVVFPREHLDLVLNAMMKDPNHYKMGRVKMAFLRKMLKLKPIPEFEKGRTFLWFDEFTKEGVQIIPLGIREDLDMVEHKDNGYKGWTHEAL